VVATITSKLELAPGADQTVNSGGWMFTDYSTFSLGRVEVRWGRSDEASTTQPAQLTCRLRNTDGRFTYLKRGTPIRYSVNPGTGSTQVYQGFVDEITPVWPAGNSLYAEVLLSASGALFPLQSGPAITHSAVYRSTIRAPGLVTYASMEEASGATGFAVVGKVNRPTVPVLRAGTIQFGADTTLPGVERAAVLGSDNYLSIDTKSYKFGGKWQFDWWMKFTGSNPATETNIQRVYVSGSTISIVDVVYGGGNWGLRTYDSSGTSLGTSIFAPPTNQAVGWWHWRVMAHDNGGGGTDLQLVTFPLGTIGAFAPLTIAGTGPGNGGLATIFPSANLNGVALSSWTVYDQYNFSATDASATGYTGENAITRMKRLAAEASIEITVSGTSSITMGPQKPGGIMQLLRDCEAADGGILYDGYSGGLSYLSEQSRYNRAATLALDTRQQQVKLPFLPTKNGQGLVNDWTLSNPAGDSAEFSDEGDVAVNGRFANSGTVNLADADQLRDLASWRVHVATVDELRVPTLQLELIDHPELWTAALALRPGHTVTAANLLDQFPPGLLGVIAEEVTMNIDATSWRTTINCSPSSPFNVGALDGSPLDCGASVLASTPTATSTTIDVAVSDGCVWSVADGPVPITVGGTELAPPEKMTVTAAAAATTTTPAFVAVGTSGISDGFVTRVVTPGLPGGATAAGNLLLMLCTCRDTNALDTGMWITGAPGWKKIIDAVQLVVFAKVHSGTEVAPTLNIPPFSTIVGDTMIAQIASFTGKWGDPASQLVAVAQQLNGSAQNIAYPELDSELGGLLVIWAGWKADDWTSVAAITTEISEVPTTVGNDSGQVWDFSTSGGPPVVPAGSFVVTGGAPAISRGMTFALRSVSQTLTVTRGVSGTTARAHTLGEEVHVTDALTAARQ
jgi:hypothetical protein